MSNLSQQQPQLLTLQAAKAEAHCKAEATPKNIDQLDNPYRRFASYLVKSHCEPSKLDSLSYIAFEENARELESSQQINQKQNSNDSEQQLEMTKKAALKNQKIWHRRMKLLFCCLGYKQNKDSIADVARTFSEVYSGLNVPTTDIAAGWVLLSKYQEAQRKWVVKNGQFGIQKYLSGIPISEQTRFLDVSTAQDSHLLNELIHYLNYSMAIFGWPLTALRKPYSLCCVFPQLRCCSGCKAQAKPTSTTEAETAGDGELDEEEQVGKLDERATRPIILDDNFCGCNTAAAERSLSRNNYDIIYINYKVDVYVTPFMVAADHSKRTIVVAIRGSMSLADMMTDMSGQTIRFPIENCPQDWLCHRGMASAAEYVRMKLINDAILRRAFNCRPDLDSQNYQLVLCGHSLGAGVAAILSIMLRKQEVYPNLRAFLFSPPGGILSLPAVEYTKQYAVGITLGSDVVARLGVAQFGHLRYYTLLSMKNSRRSKCKVLARAMCPLGSFLGSNKVEYDPGLSMNVLHGSQGSPFEYKGNQIRYQTHSPTLHVPGRLINVVRDFEFARNGTPIYRAVWTDNADYDKIMIYKGMLFDHLPHNLYNSIKMLFSKTIPASRSSPERGAVSVNVGPLQSGAVCLNHDSPQDINNQPRNTSQSISQVPQPFRVKSLYEEDDQDLNGNLHIMGNDSTEVKASSQIQDINGNDNDDDYDEIELKKESQLSNSNVTATTVQKANDEQVVSYPSLVSRTYQAVSSYLNVR